MPAIAIEKKYLTRTRTPKVITNDAQNERYIAALLEMEDRDSLTADDKNFMAVVTMLVKDYEEKRYTIRLAGAPVILAELMAANNLKQKDLATELGSESIVSAVLNGKRELNKHHIEKLSERFKVSPELFF